MAGRPDRRPGAAAAGLLAAIETPLGVGVRLRDLAAADRIREMVFELPLVGGDAPTGTLHPGDIADLLERRLGAGDPLAPYPEHLRRPGLTPALRGYLNGSIDLVARLPDGRFAVIDYKSNRLGRRPPDRLRLPPGGPGGRDAAGALPPSGAALPRRAAPLPALAPARIRPRHAPRRRRLPLPAGDDRGRRRPPAPTGGAGSSGGGRPTAWCRRSAICSPGARRDRRRRRPARGEHPARRAPALRPYVEAGVLGAADVHVARALARLVGEDGDAALLGAALAVRAPRLGHVCVDLAGVRESAVPSDDSAPGPLDLPWPEPAAWAARLRESALVGRARPPAARGLAAVSRPLLGAGARGGGRPPAAGRGAAARGSRRPFATRSPACSPGRPSPSRARRPPRRSCAG